MHVIGKGLHLQYDDIFILHDCNIYQTGRKCFYLALHLLYGPRKITIGYEKE